MGVRTELMEHQKDVLHFVKDKKRFALFLEYGLGKTLCILTYINNVLLPSDKVLVVAPKVNIISTWPLEIEKHSDFKYTLLLGNLSTVKKKLENSERICLINYDSVSRCFALLAKENFSMIVFDESVKIKSPGAIRTKASHKLSDLIDRCAILTGFPVTERLMDIWGQFRVIDNSLLGTTYWKFMNRYFYRWKFGWSPKRGSVKQIMDTLGKSRQCVFLKLEDCVKLPPKRDLFIPINPSKEQQDYFDELKDEFQITIRDKDQSHVFEFKNILPILSKMQQISSGFIYMGNSIFNIDSPKLEVLENIMSSTSGKRVIWVKFKKEMEIVLSALKDNYSIIPIYSKDDPDTIKHKVQMFQDENRVFDALLVSYDFMNSGENLTEARYSIHFGWHWSNYIMSNAKGRVYRKGSEKHKKIVYVYIYLKGTIEEQILKTLNKKGSTVREIEKFMRDWSIK